MILLNRISLNRIYEDSKLNFLVDLQKHLDTFDYGTIIDGERYDETRLDEVNWDEYRTLPVDVFESEKIGNCWDFVNYQHENFKDNAIEDQSFMFVMDRGSDDIVTHTFSIVTLENNQYWFEQSFYKYKGIWRIRSVKDVVYTLAHHYDPESEFDFEVYEYNPDGLDQNLTDKQFFESVTSSKPVISSL